jgi:biotin-dependent carboxylase-like uncharacterized protein
MSSSLDILACPVPASIQDLGRPGYRHLGVPLSGALDSEWLQIANALAGNPPHAAAIEMRLAGPHLRANAGCIFAVAGEVDARLINADGEHRLAPWQSHRLRAGEQLRVAAVNSGVAYLAFAGGIDCAPMLGSRSTYARAKLGETISVGKTLSLADGEKTHLGHLLRLPQPPLPPQHNAAPLRILAGPQRQHFTPAAWATLLGNEFEISRAADRMGLRLLGASIEHVNKSAADIVSDAVTPGVIQVPGDGAPIVLLADCQTVGGYPKIAVVISADLPRLAHLLPGSRLRFAEVSLSEALSARRHAATHLAQLLKQIETINEGPDLAALYQSNLIGGVIHAD